VPSGLSLISPQETKLNKILPVVKLPPDAALEEATAAVAGEDAVVFPRAGVSTHDARQTQRRLVLGGIGRRRRTRDVSVTRPQQEGMWRWWRGPIHLDDSLLC
jgi:hypothetical protein